MAYLQAGLLSDASQDQGLLAAAEWMTATRFWLAHLTTAASNINLATAVELQ